MEKMSFYLKLAYNMFRPQIVKWLANNALKLREVDVIKIVNLLGITKEKLVASEGAIAQAVINALDEAAAR